MSLRRQRHGAKVHLFPEQIHLFLTLPLSNSCQNYAYYPCGWGLQIRCPDRRDRERYVFLVIINFGTQDRHSIQSLMPLVKLSMPRRRSLPREEIVSKVVDPVQDIISQAFREVCATFDDIVGHGRGMFEDSFASEIYQNKCFNHPSTVIYQR